MEKFSYKKMLAKGVKYFLVFLTSAIPVVISLIPQEVKDMNLLDVLAYAAPVLKTISIGGVLVMFLNFLKVRAGVKIL